MPLTADQKKELHRILQTHKAQVHSIMAKHKREIQKALEEADQRKAESIRKTLKG